MGWADIRDKITDNPVESALLLTNPITASTIAGTGGAYYGNPIAQSYELATGSSGSDIPGVDEARELWGGITGQTAADAARDAARLQQEGIAYAADIQREMFDVSRQDQMPWLESGERALSQLESMMGQQPSFEDYQQSDYAKFLQDQAMEAIEAKSRAGGYYHTGGTSKEMMQYAQDIAGQDYQQYLNNYYQSLNPYMQMAGLGQQQAQMLGQQGLQTGQTLGQYGIQSAQAAAGGVTGAAQAQAQGIQNLIGTGALLYGMSR